MTATLARSACKLDFSLSVPAQLLWGASQIAEKDRYKGALHTVQLKLEPSESDGMIKVGIRSTNGKIAFRVILDCKGDADNLPDSICLDSQYLAKILKTESNVSIQRIGGQTTIQGFKMGIRNDAEYIGSEYPNLDAVWPDHADFKGNLDGIIAFSPVYLETIGKVAQRVTEVRHLRFHLDSPTSPAVITTGDLWADPHFLIMPVQIRPR